MITLRRIKGEPLTMDEMDNNIYELDQRVRSVECVQQSDRAFCIEQRQDVVVFKDADDRVLGQVILPRWTPRIRGEWIPGEAYAVGDWIRYKGALYMCKSAHVSAFESTQDMGDMMRCDQWDLIIGQHNA